MIGSKRGYHRLFLHFCLAILVVLVVRFRQLESAFFVNLSALYLSSATAEASVTATGEELKVARYFLQEASANLDGAMPSQQRMRGVYYYTVGHEQKGLKFLTLAGEGAEDLIARGNHAMEYRELDEAVGWFQQATVVGPDLADPWFSLGLLYENQKEPEKALTAYGNGLNSLHFDRTGESDFLLHIGLVNFQQLTPPSLGEALDALNGAIELNSFIADNLNHAYFARASVLQRLGRTKEAMEDYRWLITNNPEHYWAHIRLAALLWRSGAESAKVEELLLHAITLNERNEKAYRDLAAVYTESGQHQKALGVYEALLLLIPDDESVRQAMEALED